MALPALLSTAVAAFRVGGRGDCRLEIKQERARTTSSSTGPPSLLTTTPCAVLYALASLQQAKIVRTNYFIWKEASDLTDRQLGIPNAEERQASSTGASTSASGAAASSGGSLPNGAQPESARPAPLSAAKQLERSQRLLKNFGLLRRKCGTPHPVWMLINPMLQVREPPLPRACGGQPACVWGKHMACLNTAAKHNILCL